MVMKHKILSVIAMSMLLALPSCNKNGEPPVVPPPPEPPDVPTEYTPRNDNYLHFFIDINGDRAHYYYYFEYKEQTFHISVDVIDSNITIPHNDIGYNDNIEFNIQPICNDTRYSVNNTFNMMLNLNQERGWLRKATDTTVLSNDKLDDYVYDRLVDYSHTYRSEDKDGYNGVSVEINMSYLMWNSTYNSLYGKLTVEPAARNCESSGNEFRSYVEKGCRYSYAYTAVLVNGDGSCSKNNGEVLELSSLMETKGLIHEEKELASNFATVVDKTNLKKLEGGAQLFRNRSYFVSEGILPRELVGKSYYYADIEYDNAFTVENEGYIVIATPHELYPNLKTKIINYGFTLANDIPGKQLATNSYQVIGIQEQTDYFVKWCSSNESFVLEKWAIVISKELSSYQTLNRWEKELGQVHKISSVEALAEYAPSKRLWQGIPGIEWCRRDDGGIRLWACLFSGGTKEPTIYNYTLYYYSDDDGDTWDLAFVVDFLGDKEDDSRCFDPSMKYHDGKLHLYWNQTGGSIYTAMVCCAIVNNPGIAINQMSDIENFDVGESFFCSTGFKMNKPIILPSGEWLYATQDIATMSYISVQSSTDNGLTWSLKGKAMVGNVLMASEATIVQVDEDGNELVMYIRTDISYYQAITYSHDGGATWTVAEDDGRICPSSRQNTYRLASGNILFAHHYNTYQRENFFVGLSTNGCKSYDHNLIIDARRGTSYPDITQAEDGSIYVCWDYDRYGMKQVLFTKLTEQQLLSIDGVATMSTTMIKEVCSVVTTDHTYSLKGVVKDEENNSIANANVQCGNVSGVTNSNGEYVLNGIEFSASFNNLIVSKSGFTTSKTIIYNDEVIDYNYHPTKNITLREERIVSYKGKVVDISSSPLEGVDVKINGEIKATTDFSGNYLISDIVEAPYDIEFVYDGFRTGVVSTELSDQTVINLGTFTLLQENQCDLGVVGGTNGTKYHLYSEREENGISFYGFSNKTLASSSLCFEAWINVYGFSKTRSINTSFYRFSQNGSFAAFYMPSGSSTSMANTSGITNTVEGKMMKGYVPYSVISQYLPSGIAVNKNTELAVNFISVSADGKNVDYWQAEDIPGINEVLTGQIDKFNTKKYVILKKDNTLSVNHEEWFKLSDVQSLVQNSSAYRTGAQFNKASLASTNSAKIEQQYGGIIYSDRAASVHGFDDFRLKALDGFTFISNSVLSEVTFTTTKSGYVLIAYNAAVHAAPDGFVDIIINYSNPGLASSPAHALFNYAIRYVEAGQTITVPASDIVYIN